MTDEEIRKMAQESCGDMRLTGAVMFGADELRIFAGKVAAKENEACAVINDRPHWKTEVRNALHERAEQIRARMKP